MNTQNNNSWYVYILECADSSLYCGITTDLIRRVDEHNCLSGKGAKYTRHRQPVKLVYSEQAVNRSAASKREAQIKALSRREKLSLVQNKPANLLSNK